ncbi:hypothetical protein BJX63DRAFT_337524 [Aspergillus granulosus]|uniref:Uncharacterized protein n=1 Tax=Aspergillus granulosus TaxID=176169 RepID=A0ABR4HZ96_9EURO
MSTFSYPIGLSCQPSGRLSVVFSIHFYSPGLGCIHVVVSRTSRVLLLLLLLLLKLTGNWINKLPTNVLSRRARNLLNLTRSDTLQINGP